LNASRLAGRQLAGLRIVILGAGAAGTAIAAILQQAGVKDIIVCDRKGILNGRTRTDLNEAKTQLAAATNPRGLSGGVGDALRKAAVLIGVSGPGLIAAKSLRLMAAKPIVFALANPVPEIMPEEAAAKAWIVATGRSDYPNQINNVLAFPGIFRGALNVRARRINEPMKLAAAHAIAGCIARRELSPEYIVPSVFNREVVQRVAAAVTEAAIKTGVARKGRPRG
jgi:malate dehydrogenase (oxaloacetate-decarboxylating)